MVLVSDADDDCIDNTINASEETAAPGLPYPLGSNYTLYIPDFVPKHLHDDINEEEMLALQQRSTGTFPQMSMLKQAKGAWSCSKITTVLSCFFLNHVFASSMSYAAKEFCDAWGISSSNYMSGQEDSLLLWQESHI
jgi:hypothetical protein